MTALLAHLVDDAGLFEPAGLDMAAAVTRHRRDLASGQPMLTHRFVCPASRIPELLGHLDADDRFAVLITADVPVLADALAALHHSPCTELVGIESRLMAGHGDLAALIDAAGGAKAAVPLFVEPATFADTAGVISALAERRAGDGAPLGVKLRCGGTDAELFPTPAALAVALVAAAGAGVPAKATAGLHHAIRQIDPATGLTHHGFLNLVLAADAARSGSAAATAAMLADEDRDRLRGVARALHDPVPARAVLTCFGSCDTETPMLEAVRLGLAPTRSGGGPATFGLGGAQE
ncbi:hypothetical protein ABIC28_000044 [Rhodococcus sp. PvR044]|uniref:hypothetical protein n=1 Tax=unclassified Rhodococcus (in: high G+C Gram-positive bacteria) TaxID=192944 RepID=UPI000BDD0645|nr:MULTISPECIES: hypothetical protein [unclassified Rhodococcus (in: high G+C Gram-positive bacteria)]MBP1162512.1 hypothetical protein [Rhodococcus sp. PvR099]PTR45225.1 hypothetical protein C8K38_102365 [Rhodococcus sp. OK611]SNX89560.1 hypothetical protein SAMN05447004_102365 [Rhodococcus sp. OK270]